MGSVSTVSFGQPIGWGHNLYGEATPPPVPLTSIAAGAHHSLGVRADGSLVSWGWNGFGQRNLPSGRFVAVDGGHHFSVGLGSNGLLSAWGSGWSAIPGYHVAVSTGAYHAVAIRANGTLATWGNVPGSLGAVPAGTYSAVATGAYTSFALRADGAIAAWGVNYNNLLAVPAGTFKAIAAGNFHALGLKADGTLIAWGDGSFGQLNVPAGQFTAIAAGWNHCLAIREDGVLLTWGDNTYGQAAAQPGSFLAIAGGGFHSLAVPRPVSREWTVTSLHPPGATYSAAWGIGSGQICGVVSYSGFLYRAALWDLAGTYTDLHPDNGATVSMAFSVAGSKQAGQTYYSDPQIGGPQFASDWTGTAASCRVLDPIGFDAYSTDGTNHAGAAFVGDDTHAVVWDETPGLWTDLHPDGVDGSVAYGIGGGQQVGFTFGSGRITASLWQGSPESYVDLSPDDFYSFAYGTDGQQQVGESEGRATLWSGSALSKTDLQPDEATASLAYGVAGGYQAGSVQIGGQSRASLWHGTKESRLDLHNLLPPEYQAGGSYAWGMWVDGWTIYVIGEAVNGTTGQGEAMLWRTGNPTSSPETMVVNKFDGNGDNVAGGGSTPSRNIFIAFEGSDMDGVVEFQYSLDGAPYAHCGNSVFFVELPLGSHTVEIRAIDSSGNVDPTPASFTWSVVTPSEAIQHVEAAVQALVSGSPGNGANLPAGGNSLLVMLDAVFSHLAVGNTNAARGSLGAFINQVQAFIGNGNLTPAQGQALIAAAQAIIDAL